MANNTTPRRVLISFLGTGNYFPVYYTWEGKKVTEQQTRFVQEAIATELCKDWTEQDCIMVFRTTESNDENWVDKTVTLKDGTTVPVTGLKTTLEKIRFHNGKGLQCPVNPDGDDSYMIPTGLEVGELDQIFDCVFDKLHDEDEIYFDVTHAFRTIPLFATTLFNYARFMKRTSVKAIYYGAFEKLGPLYKLKELSMEKQKELEAPIVNLTSIVRLQELNTAASNFHEFGNLSAFSDLIIGITDLETDIQNISGALKALDSYMLTCQLDAIEEGRYMATINESVEQFCQSEKTNKAQRNLLKKISEQLQAYGFTPESSYSNIEAAIDWALDYNMVQQAYTMVKEYIVTRVYDKMHYGNLINGFVDELGLDRNKRNFIYLLRDKIGNVIANCTEVMRISRIARLFRTHNPMIGEIEPFFKNISTNRNDLNHASLYEADVAAILESLKNDWSECKEILNR